jgi:hypothetical protein
VPRRSPLLTSQVGSAVPRDENRAMLLGARYPASGVTLSRGCLRRKARNGIDKILAAEVSMGLSGWSLPSDSRGDIPAPCEVASLVEKSRDYFSSLTIVLFCTPASWAKKTLTFDRGVSHDCCSRRILLIDAKLFQHF